MTCRRFAAAFAASLGVAGAASAATFGVAVTGNNSDTEVAGQPVPDAGETAALLGAAAGTGATAGDIIGYFIPLDGPLGSCTFGVSGCGLGTGGGSGGAVMTMWIKYGGVSAGNQFLNLYFEDLDLIGANDPPGFLETVRVFDTGGTELAFFDEIADAGVGGTADTQQVATLGLGNLAAGDYWAKLEFTAPNGGSGNTPEFLIAAIDTEPAVIPLPAAGWLMIAGIGGLALVRRRVLG